MRSNRMKRSRRGMTLIELCVSVAIIGIFATVGAVNIAPQITFYRAKISAERLVNALRLAQGLAQANRGATVNNAPTRYGVTIFRRQLVDDGSTRHAYLIFRHNAAAPVRSWEKSVQAPGIGTRPLDADLDGAQFTALEYLPMDTIITQNGQTGAGDATPIPANLVLTFSGEGTLDTTPGADLVDSGDDTTEALLTANIPIPGDAGTTTYFFDIWNPALGYMRVRIRSNGTVEASGVTPANQAPVSRYGIAF